MLIISKRGDIGLFSCVKKEEEFGAGKYQDSTESSFSPLTTLMEDPSSSRLVEHKLKMQSHGF